MSKSWSILIADLQPVAKVTFEAIFASFFRFLQSIELYVFSIANKIFLPVWIFMYFC